MRFLVVGAGALGGYFGGRLLHAGQDVTFLLRPARAAQLAASGLVIQSPAGDLHLPSAPSVLAHQIKAPCDVVIVACKAYDLEGAITAFAPAVGPETAILPLLNGMRHPRSLVDRRHGPASGGVCAREELRDAARPPGRRDRTGAPAGRLRRSAKPGAPPARSARDSGRSSPSAAVPSAAR